MAVRSGHSSTALMSWRNTIKRSPGSKRFRLAMKALCWPEANKEGIRVFLCVFAFSYNTSGVVFVFPQVKRWAVEFEHECSTKSLGFRRNGVMHKFASIRQNCGMQIRVSHSLHRMRNAFTACAGNTYWKGTSPIMTNICDLSALHSDVVCSRPLSASRRVDGRFATLSQQEKGRTIAVIESNFVGWTEQNHS